MKHITVLDASFKTYSKIQHCCECMIVKGFRLTILKNLQLESSTGIISLHFAKYDLSITKVRLYFHLLLLISLTFYFDTPADTNFSHIMGKQYDTVDCIFFSIL